MEQFGDESFSKEYFKLEYDSSWLIGSAIVCNLLELVAMSLGHPLAFSTFNLFLAIVHILGFFTTLFMILQPWRIQIFLYVFIFSSAFPALLSIPFVVDRVVVRSSLIHRVDIRI